MDIAPAPADRPLWCPHCAHTLDRDGGIEIDPATGAVALGGVQVQLTASQMTVFALLWRRRPRTVMHDAIYDALYQLRSECDLPSPDLSKIHVHKLRRRVGALPVQIETVWGVGYRLIEGETG